MSSKNVQSMQFLAILFLIDKVGLTPLFTWPENKVGSTFCVLDVMSVTVSGILYSDQASGGYESNSVRVAGESGWWGEGNDFL